MEKTGTSQTSRALTVRVLTYLDRLYPRMRHTFERELHIRHGVFARAWMDQLQPNEALSLEQLIIAHRHILRYYDEKIAKGLIPSDTDRLRRERESWRKELLEWLE